LKNILSFSPEADWKKFGEIDPYYGVLSTDNFRSNKIDEVAKDKFFATGVTHVNRVFDVLKTHHGFAPGGKALDFGCGVGRITSALSSHFDAVTGLDIAPGMLAEAKRNAEMQGRRNLVYGLSDDPSYMSEGTYDFVHSFIVLQHIPVKRGESIIRILLKALKVGGFGAVHFTYSAADPSVGSMAASVVKSTPLVRNIANLMIGRKWAYPTMQMNKYSIPRMIDILSEAGVRTFTAIRVDDWTHHGLFVFFQKEAPGSVSPWCNPKRRSSAAPKD
jgi:2-polyprenyl-3-methyl-5-hydroxy-6-metoxy-1,4-benzoquinol methylase